MRRLPGSGDRLGRFTLLRELGRGATSVVYLARVEGREVAVKILRPDLLERPDVRCRFHEQAEAAARVEHPNVVRTLGGELVVESGRTYGLLVMEHVEGRTLRELLGTWGRVPEGLVREIARQVATGLAAVHGAGLVHGDLRPENVLLTGDDRVRIMDLGVAGSIDGAAAVARDGRHAGSLPYTAPELFAGSEASSASDLYALGVLLHELLTGDVPFRYADVPALLHAHLRMEAPRADERLPDLSGFLVEVIATLVAKDDRLRFESAEALASVLESGEASAWWAERERRVRRRTAGVPRVPVRRETALIGRGAELGRLVDAWQRARAGAGSTVLLSGEPGIGKTRLVDALLDAARGDDAHLLYGAYTPPGGAGGLTEAVHAVFGSARLEDALAPYLATAPALLPALVAALRGEVPEAPIPEDAFQAALVHLLRGLARERPVLWVVEDLHFATAAARRRVLALARGLTDHRALLVLTARPGLPDDVVRDLGRVEGFGHLVLPRLEPADVTGLVGDAWRNRTLAERLGPRIARSSDGVPLFVLEILRDLEARDCIIRLPDGACVETRGIGRIEVPSAVRQLVEARLSACTTAERAILDAGAVQGFEFDPHLCAAVLERPPVALLHDLVLIERRLGVVRAAGRHYRFDHHQVQEVLRERLPPRLEEELHAALADAIAARAGTDTPDGATCVLLCEHYLRGGRGDAALRLLDAAFEHLASSYRHDEAAALARRALDHADLLRGAGRVDLLLRMAERLHLLGHVEEERRALDEAARIAEADGDVVWRARVGADLGRHLSRTAHYDEAVSVLERAIAWARAAGEKATELRAHAELGGVHARRGALAAARAQFETQRDLAHELGDAVEEARAVGNLGTVWSEEGRPEEAEACFSHHLAVARRTGDRQGECVAGGNLGILLATGGRYEEAQRRLEQQLELARAIGDRHGEAKATGSLGYVAGRQGRHAVALAHHERHLALAREIGDRLSEGLASANLGHVFLDLGRYEEARTCLEDWLEISREIGSRTGEARATGQLGFVSLAQGLPSHAREHFERWLELARTLGDRAGEGHALGYLGEVALGEGRFAEAQDLFERRLALGQTLGDRRGVGLAQSGLGRVALARGEAQAAARHFERHVAAARDEHDRQGEGAARGSLGLALHALGRHEEGRDECERSLEIAREVGDRTGEAHALGALGTIDAVLGRQADARRSYETRLAVAEEIDDRRGRGEARLQLGRHLLEHGEAGASAAYLRGALRDARATSATETEVLAACHLATVDAAARYEAEHLLAACEDRLGPAVLVEGHFALFRATGDAAHRGAANTHLDALLARAPRGRAEALLASVPLYRAVRAAGPGAT